MHFQYTCVVILCECTVTGHSKFFIYLITFIAFFSKKAKKTNERLCYAVCCVEVLLDIYTFFLEYSETRLKPNLHGNTFCVQNVFGLYRLN